MTITAGRLSNNQARRVAILFLLAVNLKIAETGSEIPLDASDEDKHQAAKDAKLHNFVNELLPTLNDKLFVASALNALIPNVELAQLALMSEAESPEQLFDYELNPPPLAEIFTILEPKLREAIKL